MRQPVLALLLRLCRERAGAQAVEFALTAPTLLLLILGGVEFGRFLWTESALQMSVEQAARCYSEQISESGCTTAGGVQTFAASVAPQLNFATSVFTATTPACGYQVAASYSYQFIPHGLFPMSPTLRATACFAGLTAEVVP
jgi:Flp pilus assembly protein TadG